MHTVTVGDMPAIVENVSPLRRGQHSRPRTVRLSKIHDTLRLQVTCMRTTSCGLLEETSQAISGAGANRMRTNACAVLLALAAGCGEQVVTYRQPASSLQLALTTDWTDVYVGTTRSATVRVVDRAGQLSTGWNVYWATSDPTVLQVVNSPTNPYAAVISVVSEGQAVISASVDGVKAQQTLVVSPLPVSSLVVESVAMSEATGVDANGRTWYSYAPRLRLRNPSAGAQAEVIAVQFASTYPKCTTLRTWTPALVADLFVEIYGDDELSFGSFSSDEYPLYFPLRVVVRESNGYLAEVRAKARVDAPGKGVQHSTGGWAYGLACN